MFEYTSRIYFPRVKNYWKKTKNIYNNSYFNWFSYLKFQLDENILELLKGCSLLVFSNCKINDFSFSEEKIFSYNLGLYYEEYCHDTELEFYNMVRKNLRMRIAEVFVFTNVGKYKNVPVLCCGVNEEKKSLVMIDPLDGELKNLNLENCTSNSMKGQKKFFLLNVPGMIRVKGVGIDHAIETSLINFIERFCLFSNYDNNSICGLSFFEYIFDSEIDPKDIEGFNAHKENTLAWLDITNLYSKKIDSSIYKSLLSIKELYLLSSEKNFKKMSAPINFLKNINLAHLKQ